MIEVQHVDFISIPSRDLTRSKQFYGETLGLPVEKDFPGFAEFKAGQVTLSIWEPEAHGILFAPNPAGFALRVADVAAARETLKAAGVAFGGEIIDSGVCHMAPFQDPDGNQLILHNRYAAADAD
jgi:predicted enzyme related to lactoylglutathione lyase